MTPILYSKSETDFSNNGLGLLSDAISCVVYETVNSYFEIILEYPAVGAHADDIHEDCIIVADATPTAPTQRFRLYKHGETIDGVVAWYGQHVSYQMLHIPLSPFSTSQCATALQKLNTEAAVNSPFTFWTDISAEKDFSITVPTAMRSVLSGTSDSIVSTYGGELEFDNYDVKLHESRGSDNGLRIIYGKNLIDYEQEKHISNIVTGVYPFYKSDDEYVELTEKIVQVTSTFSYPRIFPLDLTSWFNSSIEQAPTEAELRSYTESYISDESLQTPTVSITIDWVQLWQTDEYKNSPLYADISSIEKVGMCDTVTVEFPLLGVSATAKVVAYEYDTLLDRYNSMTIGSVASNLADTIIDTADSAANGAASAVKNEVSTTINAAKTDLQSSITGAKGGYVLINYGDDGTTAEILIMDAKNKEDATNVIRMNQEGISLSQNGYNGAFCAAIGIDGTIFANEIDTWSLNAGIIKTGTLDAELITVVNLIADFYKSTSGNNTLQLSAASLAMTENENVRSKLYVDGLGGMLTLEGENIKPSGYDDTIHTKTVISCSGIDIGRDDDYNYYGSLGCATLNAHSSAGANTIQGSLTVGGQLITSSNQIYVGGTAYVAKWITVDGSTFRVLANG